MITPEDRAAWLAAYKAVEDIERMRAALVAPTAEAYDAAQCALDDVEDRTGSPVAHCEACAQPIFVGDSMLGGETPLCGTCAPTYADLLNAGELSGFVQPSDDGDWEPMTPVRARELYDAHIAGGGKPTDSMATVVTQ